METGFKDPIKAPKGKEQKSPWDFTQPHYDERSSCYVNAGTHYGVGKNQPVGHHGNAKEDGAIPRSRYSVNTMKVDETPRKNLSVEMHD